MIDVVCGHGRLGSRVLQHLHHSDLRNLKNSDRVFVDARIDAIRGLSLLDGLNGFDSKVPAHIGTLLICMVPKIVEPTLAEIRPAEPKPAESKTPADNTRSAWLGILDGVLTQVRSGALRIDQVLFVSSTAVYEAHCCGWISAQTPPLPDGISEPISARSVGLIDAEQTVRQLSKNSCVVRLAGITGPGYERYDPLTSSATQTRHAIDVRSAALSISTLLQTPIDGASTHLLTDAYVYFQGRKWAADPGDPELQALAQQHKLLLPSLLPDWM